VPEDRASAQRMVMTLATIVACVAIVVAVTAMLAGALLAHGPVADGGSSVTTAAPLPAVAAAPPPSTPPSSSAAASPAAAQPPAVPTAPPAPPATAVPGVVVIDAGHQAHLDTRQEPIGPGASETKDRVEAGTSGVVTHVAESVRNLEVALKLETALESLGVKVIMIRTTQGVDIPNSHRAAIANKAHAALFIRLHCDSADSSSTHGLLMLQPGVNRWSGPIRVQSHEAARIVDKAVLAATGARDRGIMDRNDLSGFNYATVPSILVEIGVMTNPAEDRRLGTPAYQQELADGMAKGVVEYLRTQ
jgi:N-acetylmuramoyl-L-alanine amidase